MDDPLHRARLCRRVGRFEEALTFLCNENAMHADVVFERFRVFEEMGDLRECLECVEIFYQTLQNSGQDTKGPEHFLLKLSAAYVACFVKGEWQNAMDLALRAHEEYLAGRTSYDITTVSGLCTTHSIVGKLISCRSRLKFIITKFGSPLVGTSGTRRFILSPRKG